MISLAASSMPSLLSPTAVPCSPAGGDLGVGEIDPLASAARADAAREQFLYAERQTVFDRFPDIPAPGGVRMLRMICNCYEAYVRSPSTAGSLHGSLPNRRLNRFNVVCLKPHPFRIRPRSTDRPRRVPLFKFVFFIGCSVG